MKVPLVCVKCNRVTGHREVKNIDEPVTRVGQEAKTLGKNFVEAIDCPMCSK